MRISNPFYNVRGISDPQSFFNRKNDIEKILNSLFSKQPQCISIIGQRKIGKTSLVQHISRDNTLREFDFLHQNTMFVYFDCQVNINPSTVTESFLNEILEHLCLKAPEGLRDTLYLIKASRQQSIQKIWMSIFDILGGANIRVILIFDEFEKAIFQENLIKDGVFGFLRGQVQRHENFAWITCTRRMLHLIFAEAFDAYGISEIKRRSESDFFNISVPHVLGLFSSIDTVEFITSTTKSAGVLFSREDIASILRFSGNFPFFVQLGSKSFFDAYQKDIINSETIIRSCIQEALPFWETYWERLSIAQQKILFAITSHQHLEATRYELNELKEASLIYEDEGGVMMPFSDEFGRFISDRLVDAKLISSPYSRNSVQPSKKDSLAPEDHNHLVEILVSQADAWHQGKKAYFENLIDQADLLKEWSAQFKAGLSGNSTKDAINLIQWALSKGINPANPKYFTIGSLLKELYINVGMEARTFIVALIEIYEFYVDKNITENLREHYQIPVNANIQNLKKYNIGPDIEWHGSTDYSELQSFRRSEHGFQDVGFLMRAMKRAISVCRIENLNGDRFGTGFLIAPDLLLTNYHVLESSVKGNILENIKNTILHFGCVTAETGLETKGQKFRLNNQQPILTSSRVEELDFVLLRIDRKINSEIDIIEPSPYSLQLPQKNVGLHILQHPDGDALKLAMSSNGVTGVYEKDGRIQYVTTTAGGSSGSPCFNDDWQVVALHHAERAKDFGTIREGILFASIYEEIKQYL